MSHKWTVKAAALVLALGVLAGCGGAKEPAPTPGTTPNPAPAETKFKVGMVTDMGGLNDKSFNQAAWEGLTKAQKDLGIEIKPVESKRQEDYEPNYQTLADAKFDLIWGIGFLMGDATERIATKLPKQNFALIDAAPQKPMPNVAPVLFKEEDGSFLMGIIAAKTTKSNKVGFVGGMNIPVIHHFEAGFKAGVKAINPNVEVLTVYAEEFTNPGKGKEIATAMYAQGADIVFHAAGATGEGVIEAAKETKKFVIGVDRDQNYLAPEYVISSMMKRVDVATYEFSKMAKEGKFKGGEPTILGLKEDAVGYAPSTLWAKMPADTKALVDKWAEAIKTGKVSVPNDMDKFKTWEVPKL